MADEVVVIKRNPRGEETWRYSGQLLQVGPHVRVIEALFNRDDVTFNGVQLRRGDRFVETYYSDHWYNIYEIHDIESDQVKAWYANVARPAQFAQGRIEWVDLALDLLVFPDGRQVVLDEDEFLALNLEPAEVIQAREALGELQEHFRRLFKD
jgi:uncharacterized protein